MSGQITLSGSEMDVRIEWKISHFFKRFNTIASPRFGIFNCSCALHVLPKSLGYVHMYLSKYAGSEIPCECIMGIKKCDGSATRTEKIEFLLTSCNVAGRLKLIAVEDLLGSRDTMVPDDCLTVFCNVHSTEAISDPVVNILGPPLRGTNRKRTADVLSPNTYFHKEKGSATSGNLVTSEAFSVLAKNFKDFYFNKSYTDVIFKVKDKEFAAHKLILGARSKVFAAALEDITSARTRLRSARKRHYTESCIIKADCDPDSFEDFLIFLYTADLKTVSSRNAVGLYKTSDTFECEELLKECVRCMIKELSVDTFFDYFSLAVKYNESDLLTAVTKFFIKNAKIIIPARKWLALLEEHPSSCNKLLMKFANAVN